MREAIIRKNHQRFTERVPQPSVQMDGFLLTQRRRKNLKVREGKFAELMTRLPLNLIAPFGITRKSDISDTVLSPPGIGFTVSQAAPPRNRPPSAPGSSSLHAQTDLLSPAHIWRLIGTGG